jgi:hypothetical protein
MGIGVRIVFVVALTQVLFAQTAPPKPEPQTTEARTQLNLARQNNTAGGESQRNENVRVNPIDTSTERELSRRIGATATLIPQFSADRNYFASEYGRNPEVSMHLSAPATPARRVHGTLWANHENSITSARSFFQVGGVLPARDNDYGVRLTLPVARQWFFSGEANQQKSRGMVNGNVLVPRLDERTPLTLDPILYKKIEGWLTGFPTLAPNLPGLDPRALNTNAPQIIDTNTANLRLDGTLSRRDTLSLRHQLTAQHVKAFQLVAGHNPDSDLHNHRSALTWRRTFSPTLSLALTAAFDRTTTWIRPDVTSPPERVNTSGVIQTIGNETDVPLLRTQNVFRYGSAFEGTRGSHHWHAGGELVRTQVNSREQETQRPAFTFQSNFGNDAVTNLRKGLAISYNQLLGDTYRGYRIRRYIVYFDDTIKITNAFSLMLGVRYEPMPTPTEVHGREQMPFACSCGAWAPRASLAYRLPGRWGVLRGNYSLDYSQLLTATFGQIRQNLPYAARVNVNTPDLLDPLKGLTIRDLGPNFRAGLYQLAEDLGLPYSHSYNFSWEWRSARGTQLQIGYVGSRSHRLFETLYNNRGGKVADVAQMVPSTVNARRADQTRFDVLRTQNGAKSYFDAARITLTMPTRKGFSTEALYWFSKAIDFGTDYTSTVAGPTARQSRAPSERGVHDAMKSLASFDQPHALLLRTNYRTPGLRLLGAWSFNAVWLLKSGTPFTIETGSDGPGFGNVDGQQSDRPHLLDPSVLGRIVGDPDTSESRLARSAFSYIRPDEYTGSLGRNTFRRGKIANVNLSAERNWTLPHDLALQLRAEAINALNTPQFDVPVFLLTSPTFGKITNTLNGGRVFHFRVQLQF